MNRPSFDKLRILMVGEYPRNGVVHGGVQAAVQALTSALHTHPEVEALEVVDPRYDVEQEEELRLSPTYTIRFIKAQSRLTLPTRSLFTRFRLQRIADKFRPTIVHGHGLGERGFLAASLGYPAITTIHGVGTTEMRLRSAASPARIIRERIYGRTVDRTLGRLRGMIAISQYAHDYYRKRFSGVMACIPNAVRAEFFRHEKALPSQPQFLFAGVISRVKNVTGILRAFALARSLFPEARLAIAGPFATPGDERDVYDTLQQTGGHGVTFLGNLQESMLIEEVRNSLALILFSRHENSPLAVAEALAIGTPVIATRVGGVPELLSDKKTGFLVENEDIEDLSEKMVQLLNNTDLATAMGMAAKERARLQWTPSAVTEETVRLYRTILS